MHPRYLAQREEAAQVSIEASAATLAQSLGLPPEATSGLTATDRDPAVQTMLRREGVASLLSAVISLGGLQTHETLPTLSPGSALFVPDGRLPALGEGARWCLPGDFTLYLEAGGDDNPNLVRELLVGPFREPDDRSDHELTPGNFLTDPEWDEHVGSAPMAAVRLAEEIGLSPLQPLGERPEDSKPRGESWLAERATADAKAAELESRLSELTSRLAELTTENAELSASPSASLPTDALERLVAIKGVSEKLAGEILEALKS